MNEAERRGTMQREKGRGLVRALHLSELQAAGAARALALHQADEQLDRIARVLPNALDAGLSLSEISRVTGISRPTLYELRARYGGDERDLRLAVLQTIANAGHTAGSAITEHIGRPGREISALLDRLVDESLLELEFNDDPADPAMEYWLTDAGFHALERHWLDENTEDLEP